MHVADRVRVAEVGEHRLDLVNVAGELWLDVGVDGHRACTGVLADLREELAGERQMHAWQLLGNDLADATLVLRVEERPHERYADGLDILAAEQLDAAADVVLVERRAHPSVAQHSLGNRDPEVARHEHRRCGVAEVVPVAVLLVAVSDLERVLVTAGAEEADLGTV